MIIKAYTDTGVRSENQDSFWASQIVSESGKEATLAGVFDGMGGLQWGGRCSRAVAEGIAELVKGGLGVLNRDVIQRNLSEINKSIKGANDKAGYRSGSTCTLLAAGDGRYEIHHIGDSRCYKIGRWGSVARLTEDQTAFTKYVKSGELVKEAGVPRLRGKEVSEGELNKLRSTLTAAMGVKENPGIVIKEGRYKSEDAFLLASDGFWHYLDTVKDWGKEIQNAFETEKNGGEKVESFLGRMCEYFKRKGESDNLTVIVVKL